MAVAADSGGAGGGRLGGGGTIIASFMNAAPAEDPALLVVSTTLKNIPQWRSSSHKRWKLQKKVQPPASYSCPSRLLTFQ